MTGNTILKGGKVLRKITTLTIVLLLTLALTTAAGWCDDNFMRHTQGYGAGAWYTSIFGEIKGPDGTGTIQTASLRGDLGIKNALGYNVDAEWQFSEKWGANVNYSYVKAESNNFVAPRNFNISTPNGVQAVAINDRLNTTIKNTTTTFMLRYNLWRNEDGMLDVAVAPKFISMESVVIRNNQTIWNESRSRVIPCVGLSGKQRMSDRLYFDGYAVGIGYNKNHLIDIRADLRWNFQQPGWYATLGYRLYDMRVDLDNNREAKANWNGPVVTIRHEF